jgi:hypothetical protein
MGHVAEKGVSHPYVPEKPRPAADTTAVRVAMWRAMHVQVDPPPHVVHVLRTLEPIGFWATMAGGGDSPQPAVLIRAFDRDGRWAWEDREVLDLPLAIQFTFDREQRTRGYEVAVREAARRVSQRLSARLSER